MTRGLRERKRIEREFEICVGRLERPESVRRLERWAIGGVFGCEESYSRGLGVGICLRWLRTESVVTWISG